MTGRRPRFGPATLRFPHGIPLMAFARCLRACVLLALIPTALAGCASGSGPLQFPESEGSACMPKSAAGTYWSFGDLLENTSEGTLTIDTVTLVNPVNFDNEANIILPISTVGSGESAVAIGDWPLTGVPDEVWAARQDAAGAVVEPGEQVNLLTVVGRGEEGPDGYADAVEVRYHDSRGRHFAVTSKTALGVTAGGECEDLMVDSTG